jgi:hypothetical protein
MIRGHIPPRAQGDTHTQEKGAIKGTHPAAMVSDHVQRVDHSLVLFPSFVKSGSSPKSDITLAWVTLPSCVPIDSTTTPLPHRVVLVSSEFAFLTPPPRHHTYLHGGERGERGQWGGGE